jgi:DNA-binding PadR family transcriptional regulator
LLWPPGPDAGLKDFHVALIVLCASSEEGVSPYDIAKLIQSGRGGVLGRSPAHTYKEIKILAERGYLEVEPTDVQSRRSVYHATELGQEVAQLWVERAPLELPPTDDSVAFILIRAAHFMPKATVWGALLELWDEVELRRAELEVVESRMRRDGTLTDHQRLEHSLSRGLLDAYGTWLSEVRREWQLPDDGLDEATPVRKSGSSRSGRH